MDLIDSKYIGLVSARLQKFKRVKADLYNFRCPICGDSQRYKNKARGYIYSVKNNTNFKCHNCGASMSLNNFLKKIDMTLHKKYVIEKFKGGFTGKTFTTDEPTFVFEKPVFQSKILLPLCSEVEVGRAYLQNRGIDPAKFYFAEKFKTFANSYKKVFASTSFEESRIIIPLFYNQNLIGFQGRALGRSKVKYITVMLDDNAPKIYGFDTTNKNLPIYVVEGPFDSTFLNNSVALCGADGDLRCLEGSDCVYTFDNEPRNGEIVGRIRGAISRGEKVVIWPSSIQEKDLNDMVLSGINVNDVVESHTYSGLEAQVKFTEWKKV
jgi:ssDNA-binding Zn-finger/Zn-ribbon topoisomerase 1